MADTVEIVNLRRRLLNGGTLAGAAMAAAFLVCVPPVMHSMWPRLLELAGGDYGLYTYGTVVANLGWYIPGNLFFLTLYLMRIPFFEQFKISKKPWPWASPDAAERARFAATLRSGLTMVTFNNLAISVPAIFLTYWASAKLGMPTFSTSLEDWPSTFTIAWQIAVCLLAEDTLFYFVHRTLHHKSIYANIHKWHHSFYHVVSISSEAAHPIEYIVGNLMPVLLGPMLLKAHLIVFWMFLWVRLGETLDAHSGYSFPWSPFRLMPFSSSTEAHDFHHSHNVGAFGSQFVLWDHVFGTDKPFQEYWAKRRVAEAAGSELPPNGDATAVDHNNATTACKPKAA